MCISVLRNFKVYIEVPLLLLFFAFMLSDALQKNLIIYRTCYVTLGYNKSDCALLGSQNGNNNETNHLEKLVQPYAVVVAMVKSTTEAVCCAIICLFVGPWSDKFGRKTMMILPLIGYILSYVSDAIYASFDDLSPWYSVIGIVPLILTGGVSSYMTVLLSYVTDTTDEAARGFRMGTIEACMSLGVFFGNLSSSYVFSTTSYQLVFSLSAFCCILILICNMFFIPESLENIEIEGRMTSFFQFSNLVQMVKTTFKKRQNNGRIIIINCLLILIVSITIVNGTGAVTFFYLREKFHWSLEKFTIYSAVNSVTGILGNVIGIFILHKLMGIPETFMMLVGFVSMLFAALIMGLAKEDWNIYIAALIRSLGAIETPMVRSLVSKMVPKEDCGKIFALIVSSQALIGIAGSPIYTTIYNSTLDKNSGIFNFVTAGVSSLLILVVIEIIIASRWVTTDKQEEHLV